tara:strand:+ start:281 stop:832 length:552 start_codon:yes stop_codon:yes gene_type:complete
MAGNRVYIPTFIADGEFNPSNVLPRFFFYNGLKDIAPYQISFATDDTLFSNATIPLSSFPYFDHYNTGSNSGSGEPSTDSNSLLFFNETPAYGTTPTNTLYSEYWSTYIELLYNPRTRLINTAGNIPLADYFKIELNDVITFRGNYYHLRAINDYNLVTGECTIQLLGPIIQDTLDEYFADKV